MVKAPETVVREKVVLATVMPETAGRAKAIDPARAFRRLAPVARAGVTQVREPQPRG